MEPLTEPSVKKKKNNNKLRIKIKKNIPKKKKNLIKAENDLFNELKYLKHFHVYF